MQTFGKTLRNSVPAMGLGLLTAFGIASATAVTAPTAAAQQQGQQAQQGQVAKPEFVEAYNAARAALQAGNYNLVLEKAAAALPHAADNTQKGSIEQLRVYAYGGLKKYPEQITSIELAQQLGIPANLQRNFKGMLAAAYAETGNEAKAVALTKELIDQYGGDSAQYAYIAKRELDAKNHSSAISYAQKAIDKAVAESKPESDTWYNIQLTAYRDTGKMDEFYTLLERVAPKFNKAVHWRPFIERAQKEPKYKGGEAGVDLLRTIVGAGVKLSDNEQIDLGEQAFNRGSTIEAEKALGPLVTSGAYGGAGDPQADRHKRLFESIKNSAKADRSGGLVQSEKEAATKATGEAFVATGEAYMGAENYAKAVELIQKGLEKGQMEPGATELARLRLGIAQYRAGDKEAARKTWSEVKGENGAAWLARVWTAISNSKA